MVALFSGAVSGLAALLMPTTPCVAQPLSAIDHCTYNPAMYTRLAAWLGCCAVAIPNGTGFHGLPTSLQMIGLPNSDRSILELARSFEVAAQGCLRSHRTEV